MLMSSQCVASHQEDLEFRFVSDGQWCVKVSKICFYFSTTCCEREKSSCNRSCTGDSNVYSLFHYTSSVHLKLIKNTMMFK